MDHLLRQGYAWACERLYHELAWRYDLVSTVVSAGGWDAWHRLALAEVQRSQLPAAAPLLEIGFGTGALLAAARKDGLPIIGLELSQAMHAVTTARLTSRAVEAPRVRASATDIPFHNGCFGAVISTFPSSYILDNGTLRECARVLYDGGALIIVGLWVMPRLAGHRLHLPLLYGDLSPTAKTALIAAMESAGFEARFATRTAGNAEIGLLIARKPD